MTQARHDPPGDAEQAEPRGLAKLRIVVAVLMTNLRSLPFLLIPLWSFAVRLVVRGPRFFATDEVVGRDILEASWADIRREWDAYRVASPDLPYLLDVDPGQQRVDPGRRWQVLGLIGFGTPKVERRTDFADTLEALEGIDGLANAMFSVHPAGFDLKAHRGLFCGLLLRVHLGVDVPCPDECGIDVAGETRHWHEGRTHMFDEGWSHQTWNHGDAERVILILDVHRPMPYRWLDRFNRRLVAMVGGSKRVAEMRDKI